MAVRPAWIRVSGALAPALLLACGPASVPVADTFAPAHSVVRSWWQQNEAAFISGNPASLAPLYAGSALEVASGQMAIQALKSSRPKYPRPFRGSTIFEPDTRTDGSWFLAVIAYAPVDQDGRAQQITRTYPGLLFSESNGSWKVDAADVQAPIPHPALGDADQTLAAPLAEDHYILASSAIASAYAAYLTGLSAGSSAEVPFTTGPSSFGYSFGRISWPPGSIATARFTFDVVTPVLVAYSITSGFTQVPEVVLFALRRTVVIKPRSGCLVRTAADIEWNDIVAPGSYSSITLVTIAVAAASVPLNNADTSQGRKVIDVSAGMDDIGATTVKC